MELFWGVLLFTLFVIGVIHKFASKPSCSNRECAIESSISEASLTAAARVGITTSRPRKVVTITITHLIYQKERHVIEGVVNTLRLLVEVCDLYLILKISKPEEQRVLVSMLTDSGLLLSQHECTNSKIPPHKCLFHSTETGKVAIVRQLRPQLHIDSDSVTLSALEPYVPRVVKLTENPEVQETNWDVVSFKDMFPPISK